VCAQAGRRAGCGRRTVDQPVFRVDTHPLAFRSASRTKVGGYKPRAHGQARRARERARDRRARERQPRAPSRLRAVERGRERERR
jgi:hypothetical protein